MRLRQKLLVPREDNLLLLVLIKEKACNTKNPSQRDVSPSEANNGLLGGYVHIPDTRTHRDRGATLRLGGGGGGHH